MKKTIFLLVCLTTAAALAQVKHAACGGPSYPCALHQTNAQLTVIPLPDPIPDIGGLEGANRSIVVQPYGTTVIRCTDKNTDPENTKLYSYEVTDTGGNSVYSWNLNQRLLRMTRMGTGGSGVVGFDPATGKCSAMNPDSVVPAGPQWSLRNPNVDFYQDGTIIIKRTWDYTQPLKAPTFTTLFNFVDVCPMMAKIPVTWDTQILTNDDDLFSMAFGTTGQGQDTAQYVVSYQMSAEMCWLLNTMTGHVQRGQRGENTSVITDLGIVSTFFPFTIHSMNQTPAGPLMIGIGNTCTGCPKHGPFFWEPRTTRLDLLTATPVGGHNVAGRQTFINISAAPKMASRPFIDMAAVTYISDNAGVKFPTPNNMHISWQNGDLDDTYPFCGSEQTYDLPTPPQITTPLMQEIFCTDPTDGTYIRISPTFSSGIGNPDNFRTKQAILTNGRLGYIAFSSDWEGKLGNTDGVKSTCTLGAKKPDQCRSDVFIAVPH